MTNRKIQLTTVVDGQTVDVFPNTKSEFVEFADGKTLEDKINKLGDAHGHSNATPDKDGFMSKEDKAKLDNVTNYTHPSTHAATMITEDATHRFVTDAEKTKWDNKADTTMASKTNAGLMSASDKQRIDGLNAEFKTRDDKITKNTEDIKSWNDEMINKEYQYFNGKNNIIKNSINSKTTDMVIKGKTLQNIFVQNQELISQSTKLETSSSSPVGLHSISSNYYKMPVLLKPNTTYTVIPLIKISNNSFERNELYLQFNISGMSSPSLFRIYQRDFNKPTVITSPSSFEKFTDKSLFFGGNSENSQLKSCIISKFNLLVIEGRVDSTLEYFEGIKSFGQKERKINVLSHGKNFFNDKEFSEYINNQGELIFKKEGNTKINPHFCIFKEKDATSDIILYANGVSNRQFTTIEQEKYYLQVGLNGDKVDNKAWREIMLPPNTTLYFSSKFSTIGNDTIMFKDIQIEEGTQLTDYKPYEEDQKNILLENLTFDEGLEGFNENICDELNYSNKTALKKVDKYIINGSEDWSYMGNQSTGNTCYLCSDILDGKVKYPAPNFICDSFAQTTIWNVFNNVEGIAIEGDITGVRCLRIRIEKSKLSTDNVQGFKEWLKNNPVTIYYELKTPIEIKLKDDINIKTFKEKTYITSNNSIKGNLSFSVPMNTAANLENNSSRLNNIENYIDNNKSNIDKISKLEEGLVTSSLNIVDLQKEINSFNNYTYYNGRNIIINNSNEESKTSNLIIKGETLKNLFKSQNFYDNKGEYLLVDIAVKDEPRDKIVYVVNNTDKTITLNVYKISGEWDSNPNIPANSIIKLDLTGKRITGFLGMFKNSWTKNDSDKYMLLNSCIVLETNQDYIPDSYFEGIKSCGEKEDNKITILSNGKNLFDPKNFITGERNGITYTIDDEFITLNGRSISSDVELIPFGNYINIETNKNYKLTYKKIGGATNNDDIRLACKNGNTWIGASSVDKNLAVISNSKKRLERIRLYVPENTVFDNFKICLQLEKTDGNYTEYESYRCEKIEIPLKEPLNKNDYIFEKDGQVKVFRKYKRYTFTGNEQTIVKSNVYGDVTRFDYRIKGLKRAGDIVCNNFSKGTISTSNLECINIHATDNLIQFQIKTNKLSTQDIDGFRKWLRDNPTTIIYELENPAIENINNHKDISLPIYKGITNIQCINDIKGDIEFNIPNNLKTQESENVKNINKNSSSINSINDKVSTIENAQMATALNVLELQKDISMLTNYQLAEYKDCRGNSFNINDTINDKVSSTKIYGNTLFNLVKNRFEKRVINRTTSVLCTNEFFQANTIYTIVYTVNSIDSGNSKAVLNFSGGSEGPDIYLTDSMTLGTHKQTFSFSTEPNKKYTDVSIYHFDDSLKKFSDVMIFKGEIDFIPTYFEGIKSVGETEYNYLDESQISLGYIGADGGNKYVIPSSDDGTRTAIIPCEPNTMYTITKEYVSDRFLVATSPQKPTLNMRLNVLKQVNTAKWISVITPNDAKYLAIYLTMDIKQSNFGKVSICKNSVPVKWITANKYKINISSQGINLFDKDKAEQGLLNVNTGELYGTNTSFSSDYIRVEKGKNYIIRGDGGEIRTYYGVLYDNYKNYVKHKEFSKTSPFTFDQDGYFRFSYASGEDEAPATNIILIEGTQINKYEPYIKNEKNIYLSEPLRRVEDIKDIVYEQENKILIKRYVKKISYSELGDCYLYNTGVYLNRNEYCIRFNNILPKLKDYSGSKAITSLKRYNPALVSMNESGGSFITLYQDGNTVGRYVYVSGPLSEIGASKTDNELDIINKAKQYFEKNPFEIYYTIEDPIPEEINIIDIDANTYSNKTYINTSNSIKADLEFKISNNIAAVMKNISNSISKIFNSLNNILNIKGE